ncbi:MAG: isochorismatase family protein [Acidobacteriia bacterium]|jgi:nicotinamidase-related amidase|nr:isochorismatase family protein [Terriglobia bacterium]
MNNISNENVPHFGSEDLRLPDELRQPLLAHLAELKAKYLKRDWGAETGFGDRPAMVVIDLAKYWVDPTTKIGSDLESVVESTCRLLKVARKTGIPIFFTSLDNDPEDPRPQKIKLPQDASGLFDLDPRLNHQTKEPLILKKYSSAFKGTAFLQMLAALKIDTLIVTGVSTSHCVYATCRDAVESFRVIVPREAVGERCEIMHLVNLLDIGIDIGDVLSEKQVIHHLETRKN